MVKGQRICSLVLAISLMLCFGGSGVAFAEGDYLTPCEETVHLTYPAVIWDVATYPEGQSVEDNIMTRKVREALNIQLEPAITVGNMELWTQLNLMVATDTLPDFFYVDNMPLLATMIASDMLAPLEDVYEQYASPNTRAIVDFNDNVMFQKGMSGGHMYAIPAPQVISDQLPVIFVRDDWMENVGLEAPDTWEGWMEVAYAFAHYDPDGNGKDDTYGMTFDATFGWLNTVIKTFCNVNGVYWNQWIEKDGKLVFGSVQPEMKQVLAKMNQAYKDRIFDPNYQKFDMRVGLDNNRYGLHIGAWYQPMYELQTNYQRTGVNWSVYPIPSGPDGLTVQVELPAERYIVVSKNCKHPEAVMKLLNFNADLATANTEFGEWWRQEQATTLKDHAAGALRYIVPIALTSPWKDTMKENAEMFMAAVEARDPSLLPKESTQDLYNQAVAGDSWGWGVGIAYGPAQLVMAEYKDYLHFNAFSGPPTPTQKEKENDLYWYGVEVFHNIIQGVEELDAFDTFVEEWYRMGGADWTNEVNAWYEGNHLN